MPHGWNQHARRSRENSIERRPSFSLSQRERSIGSGMPPACPEQRGALFTQCWAHRGVTGRVRVIVMSIPPSTSPRAAAQLAPLLRGEGKKGVRTMCESSRRIEVRLHRRSSMTCLQSIHSPLSGPTLPANNVGTCLPCNIHATDSPARPEKSMPDPSNSELPVASRHFCPLPAPNNGRAEDRASWV
jgi:hypothetical protein